MYLTGFADEASDSVEGQIQATRELGWRYLEGRNVGGKNLHDLPPDEFDRVSGAILDAGLEVNCFGSAIANWAKSVTDPFAITAQEIERAIPRMQRLKAAMVRVMSYAAVPGAGQDQLEGERFERLREIKRRFNDAGLEPVHENCNTWGGLSWKHTLKLVDEVPGLKLVFDTGNPVESEDQSGLHPGARQSSLEYYTKVRPHIAYIHIKDGVWDQDKKKARWTFPGEGQGNVKEILAGLARSGYQGGLSIEPHMAVVAHDPSVKDTQEQRYRNFVEYGNRLKSILAGLGIVTK